MKRQGAVVIFLTLVFVFSMHAYAHAFQAEVLPFEIGSGEAFIIKVTSTKNSKLPIASLNGKQFYFSSCAEGCFIAIGAIGIETKPGVYTIMLRVGKEKKNLRLVVKHISYPTLSLTLPEDKVFLSTENLRRAKKEDKKLKSICQIVSDRFWEGSFILPLENDIATAYGTKRIINKKMISVHKGVDIKGQDGLEAKASNNGKIVLAEELFFGGNTIIIDHGKGIYTIYMHLSKFNVKPQGIVSKGDIIGLVGSSGRSSGPHLHFGVKVMNMNINPVSLIKLSL